MSSQGSPYSTLSDDLDDFSPFDDEYRGYDNYDSDEDEDKEPSFVYLLISSSILAKLSSIELLPKETKKAISTAFSSSILLLTEVCFHYAYFSLLLLNISMIDQQAKCSPNRLPRPCRFALLLRKNFPVLSTYLSLKSFSRYLCGRSSLLLIRFR